MATQMQATEIRELISKYNRLNRTLRTPGYSEATRQQAARGMKAITRLLDAAGVQYSYSNVQRDLILPQPQRFQVAPAPEGYDLAIWAHSRSLRSTVAIPAGTYGTLDELYAAYPEARA